MKSPISKFTIDRNTWLRGEGEDQSFLLRKDGKMCCLGHYGLARGLSKEDIAGKKSPKALLNKDNNLLLPELCDKDVCFTNNNVCYDLMSLNDRTIIKDERQREEYIQKVFKEELGVEVEFVN